MSQTKDYIQQIEAAERPKKLEEINIKKGE